MNILNLIYYIITSFFFIVYWTQVGSWYNDGVDWYGIIGAGVAANGAFFGNIIHGIIEKNDAYKSKNGGKDMPFVNAIKKIFGR
jgi:hypothetical protein